MDRMIWMLSKCVVFYIEHGVFLSFSFLIFFLKSVMSLNMNIYLFRQNQSFQVTLQDNYKLFVKSQQYLIANAEQKKLFLLLL